MEDVNHRKIWDHPNFNVVNEIDVVHDNNSSDFELVVDLAAPVVDEEDFTIDEDEDEDDDDDDDGDDDEDVDIDDEELSEDNNNANFVAEYYSRHLEDMLKLLIKLTVTLVGRRWISRLLALGLYAMLLMPGFLQGLSLCLRRLLEDTEEMPGVILLLIHTKYLQDAKQHEYFVLDSTAPEWSKIRASIERDCQDRYKDRKSKLKKYFEKVGGDKDVASARRNRPPHLDVEQWNKAVDLFKRGNTDLQSAIDNWRDMHYRSNGGWVNDLARKDYVRDHAWEVTNSTMQQDGSVSSSSVNEKEIVTKVLGESHGHNTGIGRKLKRSAFSSFFEPPPPSPPPPPPPPPPLHDDRTVNALTALHQYIHEMYTTFSVIQPVSPATLYRGIAWAAIAAATTAATTAAATASSPTTAATAAIPTSAVTKASPTAAQAEAKAEAGAEAIAEATTSATECG
ncbi:LOW QUALITY PROTEIN: hypothetical protein OSB04_002645 [Centaurea solstitialis]|uniref:Uncharacterized protein n=1 Tax=Centaurea solstitialis TaxID=347529 RepID=A0AA38TV58_9ASTR|nr:LOW QUALITY PROTEIN: hypothetical protein OSB04_002645 [Centaurea solstitialis]